MSTLPTRLDVLTFHAGNTRTHHSASQRKAQHGSKLPHTLMMV